MYRLHLVTALAVTLSACSLSTNPDHGRYSCVAAFDCGAGYECKLQFDGGARCFKDGECSATETCNGSDDNCDGRVDETFADAGAGCDTDKQGVCKPGALVCTAGSVVCAQTVQPGDETCNGLDDDCDGTVDNGFDLTTSNDHCGACNHACQTGMTCVDSHCAEGRCGDFIDNDSNGLIDCADPACFEQVCDSTVQPARRCGFANDADAGTTDAGLVRACLSP